MSKELIRPVRCHFCGEPMYYSYDPRYKPEVSVKVRQDGTWDIFFAHVKCWNERMDAQ